MRHPEALGYGLIFLSGIISDVVFGLPLGINALSLLIISAVAAYVRVVTVNVTLISDWISFVPAILLANFIYFISLPDDNKVFYFFTIKKILFDKIFFFWLASVIIN